MIAAPRPSLLATLALVALAGCATSRPRSSPDDAPHRAGRDRRGPSYERRSDAPDVRVWLSGGDGTYHAGERVRALFRTEDDGYVTIVRIDTDGRLRILYPRAPYEDNWVRAGHTYRVPGGSSATFTVDDPTGVGYVFAISSYQPFDFERVSYHRGWDHRAAGDPVRGDPFLAIRRLADLIAVDDRTGYATAYDEYYVGRRVAYPRYACYDCHGSSRIPVYEPYGRPCPRYRIVVYDDSYYPYRYYPGTRVVYSPRSRYEFKEIATRGPIAGGPAPGRIGGGAAPPNDGGSSGVEHRRRVDDVDPRRPKSPTADPNVGTPATSRGSAGATRPGDDLPASAGSERRIPDDRSASSQPVREGMRTPRRDGETAPAPATHVPGAPPPARPDDGDDDRPGRDGRGGRREPPGWGRGANESERGAPPRERAPERRSDPPRDERRDDRGEPRSESRGEPRREERTTERRADPPRREPPRDDARRDDPPREEARREERTRSEPRREEPRSEPRREEPRSEPRREEPRSESRREEPRSESTREERRPEPKSESRPDERPPSGARRRAPE